MTPPLTFRPLTPRLMDELGAVLRGSWGSTCWCMFPRLTNAQMREHPDLHEFFAADPLGADRAFFGRESHSNRRGFLRGAGLTTMAALAGAAIPFHRNMPAGLIPAAFADENPLVGKDGLTLLNDRPLNAETPPHLLDDSVTPTARHFIRNNGVPPADEGAWQDFRATVELPGAGYYDVWARATDSAGVMQPHAIDWNPKGYLNNTMHRVAFRIA